MYELMLDTANLEDLKEGLDSWPVVGVTSNPTILKEEGGIDVYALSLIHIYRRGRRGPRGLHHRARLQVRPQALAAVRGGLRDGLLPRGGHEPAPAHLGRDGQ